MSWSELPTMVISLVIYWAIVAVLAWFAVRRHRAGRRFVAVSLVPAYMVAAAAIPAFAVPWIAIALYTHTPFYPVFTRILALEALSYNANLSLLKRSDIRTLTIEYRFAKDGRERVFLTSVRCAERYAVHGEFAEWRMSKLTSAIGGELSVKFGEEAVDAYSVPPGMLCDGAKRLREGPSHALLFELNSSTSVAVSVIDRTRTPPLVATFNLGPAPLAIRGLIAYPPVVIAVADSGQVTREDLLSEAPPFSTDRDRGNARPLVLKGFRRQSEGRSNLPIADFVTTSSWCGSMKRREPGDSSCME